MSHSIETQYLGLKLKSPVIVSSSGLTSTLAGIKKAEAAGAGAVVLKSIFEEQIQSEIAHIDSYSDYPEAADYIRSYVSENNLSEYIAMIQQAKRECAIPVIASINCREAGQWVEFARVIETAGADAIELNIFLMPTDKELEAAAVEKRYLTIVEQVRDAVTIPLAVKLAPGFTNPLSVVRELYYRNTQGVVMFNRLYPFDIDIEQLAIGTSRIFSHRSELSNVLRWTGLVNGALPLIDVAVSTGVHTGEDVVKALLAGAAAVEVASVLYEKGVGEIAALNSFVQEWMARHEFASVADFRGKLNAKKLENPALYERTQFMRHFSQHE